jgi:hypothetical protein
MAVAVFTPQSAIDEFSETYPSVTAARALTLFLQVFRELLAECQVEQGSQDETLTDGTREYETAYAPRMTNIREAYLVTSATARKKLIPVSTDWMDRNRAGWRETTDTGEPSRYYVAALNSSGVTVEGKIVVGLDPIPDTDTGVTYPFLRLYGTLYEDLIATDKIPAMFPNVRVFSSGMKMLYARSRDRARAQEFYDDYQADKQETITFINQIIEDNLEPQFYPTWMVSNEQV